MAILILISLFFALPISGIFWQILPLPKLVQFPWRFLSLTTFALAVFLGRLPKKIAIIATILVIFSAIPFLKVERTFHPEDYYTTNDATTTVQDEYMPKWVKTNPQNRPAESKTVYFPGVKVVVNGQEVEPEVDNNGMVATPGKIVFRETPVRLLADYLTLFGVLIILISWFSKTVWPDGIKGNLLGK